MKASAWAEVIMEIIKNEENGLINTEECIKQIKDVLGRMLYD